MAKLIKSIRNTDLPPGTLIHIGTRKTEKVKITLIEYDESDFQEKEVKSVEECFPFKDRPITWINVDGLHRTEIIKKIGSYLKVHPLVLEDVANTGQRPKTEDHEDYLFIVLKMFRYDRNEDQIVTEQVSIILGSNYVVSFQEREGDIFNAIRERLRNGKGRIRKMRADYLAYSLVDTVIDHYFTILERLEENIESLEEELLENPTAETLQGLHSLKRELAYIRKSIWPLRELVSALERSESKLIQENTHLYLRDAYDHTIQVIDTVETFRDLLSGMLDLYLSSISNRMNEVMKVLTIIATIFIPLTLIAGIYGMNFRFMPELEWQLSYPIILLAMTFVGVLMLVYFKRKNWL